jgi:nucleoside-diphosphate-sugar epimerase
MLGREIVHALGKDPQTWTTVHALSRHQKEAYPSNVIHDTVDLTAPSPEKLAQQFKDHGSDDLKDTIATGGIDYVFFAAYLARDDEAEAAEVNGGMLKNFLSALALMGADRNLRRVVLVTGAKQYGVHLGPVKLPMEEDDPWIEGEGRPPNFYYTQQRVLAEAARKSKGNKWDWVVTYPNDVIGVAKGMYTHTLFLKKKKEGKNDKKGPC